MGWLGTLGKIAGIAGAGLATAATGGAASPLLAAAVGAGGAGLSAVDQFRNRNKNTVAPGTGGVGAMPSGGTGWLNAITPWIGAAGDIASVWGQASGARGEAQQQSEAAQLTRDRLNLDRSRFEDQSYLDRADVDLKRRNFEIDAPGARLDTGLRASMAANAQPVRAGSGSPLTLPSGRSINPISFSGMDPSQLIGDKGRTLSNLVLDSMIEQQTRGDKFDPIPAVNYPKPQGAPEANALDRTLSTGALVGGTLGAAAPYIQEILRRRQQGGVAAPIPQQPMLPNNGRNPRVPGVNIPR